MGMTTMGKMSATIMPEIITLEILLNTDRLPRWVVLRVDSGTIRL